MRLLAVFLLLATGWRCQQTSAAKEDPEKYCPCLPPRLCPRIFGLSPVDSKQIGQLPDCTDLTTVRCCGASLTVITEHLGTTKYDEDYLRLGKSPVYIPAKMKPVPIPENVMRQIQDLSAGSSYGTKNEETNSSIDHSVQNNIEEGNSSTSKSITIENTPTSNDITTPNPTTVANLDKSCDECDQSDSSSTPENYTTEKYISMSTNEIELTSSHISRDDYNGTDENNSNARTNEQIETSTIITVVGESVHPGSTTILSDLKLDTSSTTDPIDTEERGKINVNASRNLEIDTKQTSSNESVAIVNAQPYNVKTMRNLEMPQEVFIILPNEETGRMMSENGSNITDLQVNENKINSSSDSNEIDDDQLQNATNRQEVIEKHLDSIVFQNWENETKSVGTERSLGADGLVEDTSQGMPETTTETISKRPKSSQIRHNLYTRKPNSSILLQSRNRINEVSTSTTATIITSTTTKKDESVIRREEIERISNLTRDQIASGSEYVPVVVRKPPPAQFKEPSSRARAESKAEEGLFDTPPIRAPHFRHPPRVLKPVTTTKQPVTKVGEANDDYDYGDAVEDGEETNNDEVVVEGDGGQLVRTPSRGRQQLIARGRGGNLFKTPPTVEEDKSVDTSEEERKVAMHEFRKIRGQSKFRQPTIQSDKPSTEETVIARDVVTEGPKPLKQVETEIKQNPRSRVRARTRIDTAIIPDSTTILPVVISTLLSTTHSKLDEDISSTTEAALLFQNDDNEDESLLEAMEPRNVDSKHITHTQQVKPIEVYEGKKLNPVQKNQNPEIYNYTGRRLVEKKKNIENVTDKNVETTEKVVVPEVYSSRKLATTTRKPIVVAAIRNNSSSSDKLNVAHDKSEDKPSITDEINDKETRQQNSGLQSENRQRLRKNRLQVAPKIPQSSRIPHDETTKSSVGPKEHTTTPQPTTETPPEQKPVKTNFRGNFLRTRNRIGMIETMIKEKMLMEHAALKSRMLRNAVESGKTVEESSGNQHVIGDIGVSQLRGGRLSHDSTDQSRKNVGVEVQNLSDVDLESEGTEQQLENRQVPLGFSPPTRMERGFVPMVSQSVPTEDGVPMKQLLPEESKPHPRFNEQQTQNSLRVVGPLPNGFHHEALRSTSAFTEDGVPVKQLQLPEESNPPQSFTDGQLLQNHLQLHNQKSLPSFTEQMRIEQPQLPVGLKPPQSSTEGLKHGEEVQSSTDIHQKDTTITKRTLTELVPPVLEAVFFRRTYDDTLAQYNEALMKYISFLKQHPPNSRKDDKHVVEVKSGSFQA